MNCTEVKYYMNDYANGILLDEVRAEIHLHLNSCNSCSKLLDETLTKNASSKQSEKFSSRNRNTASRTIAKRKVKKIRVRHPQNKIPPESAFSIDSDESNSVEILNSNSIYNNKLFVFAGIISAIAFGAIFAFIIFDRSSSTFWPVEKISGHPVIESRVLANKDVLKIGETLFTDAKSKALLKIGQSGEIEVQPESEIKIVETPSAEHQLVINRGKINSISHSALTLFSISTPSSEIKDLGGRYNLIVNDSTSSIVHANSGWVLVKFKDKKSLLPAHSSCISKKDAGLGTPFLDDASQNFKETLAKIDFEHSDESELQKLLAQSRAEDIITLFHLLINTNTESRSRIFNRIASLHKLSPLISAQKIISGDKEMLGRLWLDLGLGSISLFQNV